MEKMGYKGRTMLALSAVIVQGIAFLITIGVFLGQKGVKMVFSGTDTILGVTSVPVAAMITNLCPLILYLMFMSILFANNQGRVRKAISVVFFVMICVLKLILQFVPTLESFLVARQGVEALASLSVLNSAISMVAGPIGLVAFGLFCLATGMCLGEAKEGDVKSADSSKDVWQ